MIKKHKTSLVLIYKYKHFFPSISNIVRNQLNRLLQKEPITAFKRNGNLKELI